MQVSFLGLRHWAEDDDPWVEHARFSIDCYFLLQKKGEEFVNLVRIAMNPHAVRAYCYVFVCFEISVVKASLGF